VLAVLGSARTHQQSFVLFVVIVTALAAGIVAVFAATGSDAREDDAR
jgi:hypothetical protein